MLRSCVILTLLSSPAFALHEVYIKEANKIPLYAQETSYWCGAATAQMMLEGFPADKNHAHPQSTIWKKIQTLKVEGWYTDPDGLERVLAHYGTGTKWRAHCVQDSQELMRFMVANLTKKHFPVGALVYGSGHWIAIIGATTDVHPLSLAGAKLEKIEAFDPWKAQHVLVSGETWFEKYWYKPVGSGKWRGCYLAVHEGSPSASALWTHLETEEPSAPGYSRVFDSTALQQRAKQFLSQIVSETSGFQVLSSLDALEPFLVRHDRGDYYLVPLGDRQSGRSHGAVMINAESGDWEGLSQFAEPHRYLTRRQALRGVSLDERGATEWVFSPSHQSRSPFHPALRIEGSRGEGPTYVDQRGRVSAYLQPLDQD